MVGRILTADEGEWTGNPTLTFVWLRNGVVIPGATGGTRQVATADAGQRLAVRVSASSPGRTMGAATSPTVAIYRIASAVKVSPGTQRVKLNRRAPLKVTMTVPGILGATGTVRVYDGTRLMKTLNLRADQLGVVRTKIYMRRTGKRVIKVRYSGTTGVLPKSATAIVRVYR